MLTFELQKYQIDQSQVSLMKIHRLASLLLYGAFVIKPGIGEIKVT